MIILPIVGLILVAVAVAIIGTKVLNPGGSERSSRLLRRVRSYSFTQRGQEKEEKAGVKEKVDDVATKVGTAVVGRSRSRSTDAIQADLLSAGVVNNTPPPFPGGSGVRPPGLPTPWVWLLAPVRGQGAPLLIVPAHPRAP